MVVQPGELDADPLNGSCTALSDLKHQTRLHPTQGLDSHAINSPMASSLALHSLLDWPLLQKLLHAKKLGVHAAQNRALSVPGDHAGAGLIRQSGPVKVEVSPYGPSVEQTVVQMTQAMLHCLLAHPHLTEQILTS